ncbi:MAG: hypothetical protein CMB06_04345 [Euryarchaeota archaeon]|nr:hypothetical protein [Euryarchaeota archaeon]|tara:strand:+ start:575 stop:1498 length:924 start_codon:yes stop_codon:yes gene_type:complete
MDKNSSNNNPKEIFGCGLLMGMADAVPGVSGGTIALILGIYDRLLNYLSICVSFVRKGFPNDKSDKFLESIYFLLPLGLGMLVSYYVITKLLVGSDSSPGLLMDKSTAPYIFSFFFGLVLMSIKEPWSFVNNPEFKNYFIALVGAVIVFFYTRFPIDDTSSTLLVLSGILALTAMLLPGISGALVLLTLGLYEEIVGYVHNVEIIPLSYFFLGGIISLFTFVPFMSNMLNNHRELTMSLLTGLMVGSLITLWPWKEEYGTGSLPENLPFDQISEEFNFISLVITFFFFTFGALSSYGIKYIEKKLAN